MLEGCSNKVIEIELEFLIDGLTTKIILKGDTTSAIKRDPFEKSPMIEITDLGITFVYIIVKFTYCSIPENCLEFHLLPY